jgi:hypothetical protein
MINDLEKGGIGSGKYPRKKHDFKIDRNSGTIEFKLEGETFKLSAKGFLKFIKDMGFENYFSSVSFNTLGGQNTFILDVKKNTWITGKIRGQKFTACKSPEFNDLTLANIKPAVEKPFEKIQFNLDKSDKKMKEKQKQELGEIDEQDVKIEKAFVLSDSAKEYWEYNKDNSIPPCVAGVLEFLQNTDEDNASEENAEKLLKVLMKGDDIEKSIDKSKNHLETKTDKAGHVTKKWIKNKEIENGTEDNKSVNDVISKLKTQEDPEGWDGGSCGTLVLTVAEALKDKANIKFYYGGFGGGTQDHLYWSADNGKTMYDGTGLIQKVKNPTEVFVYKVKEESKYSDFKSKDGDEVGVLSSIDRYLLEHLKEDDVEKSLDIFTDDELEKGGVGSGKYLHKKEFNHGITIHSNIDREYNKNKVAPWDKKGSERGTNNGDLENIAIESEELSHHKFVHGKDNWKTIAAKLKNSNEHNLELYKDKTSFKLKPIKEDVIKKSIDIFEDNDLEKAVNPHKTWKWIKKTSPKGKVYYQRYNTNVEESKTEEESLAVREEQWNRSVQYAGLKDKLNYATKLNDKYYDDNGKQIHIPERFKDVVEKLYNPKDNARTLGKVYGENADKKEKQHTKELEGKIRVNDEILNYGLEADKKEHGKIHNEEKVKEAIKNVLSKIDKDTRVDHIITALEIARGKISNKINPTVKFSYNGKSSEVDLDDMLERIKKTQKENGIYKPLGINNVEIDNIDDFDESDLNIEKHKIKDQKHLDKLYEKGKKLKIRDNKKAVKDPDAWGGEAEFKKTVGKKSIQQLRKMIIELKKKKTDTVPQKNIVARQVKIAIAEIAKKKIK